jgi:hypothetical protein
LENFALRVLTLGERFEYLSPCSQSNKDFLVRSNHHKTTSPMMEPPDKVRTVEVQTDDGRAVWLAIEGATFGDVADRMVRSRHLMGRLIDGAAAFDTRRMVIPVERIKLIIDVDG